MALLTINWEGLDLARYNLQVNSRKAFNESPYFSTKHTHYFKIYDQLFNKFQNKKITVAEIGVLSGGSLHMWKKFFGHQARIIGIDLNPDALRWEHEFSIFIGDQGDPEFWESFYRKVGKIDILIDDGGHKNRHQIQTVVSSLPFIKNGGLILTEDTHTSYMSLFGNPSKYSFMNFAIDKSKSLTKKHDLVNIKDELVNRIYSIRFFDSIVAIEIEDTLSKPGSGISNKGKNTLFQDYKNQNLNSVSKIMRLFRIRGAIRLKILKKSSILRFLVNYLFAKFFQLESKLFDRDLRKYFKQTP
jgi:hypothetical protein